MYHVFIADDEKHVRAGLKKHVSWAEHRLQVVGESDNGKDALEYLLHHPVDILITDVKMPLMDGIELVRRLREEKIRIKIIFISGYDDFEYLRSALRLDAMDYIMKSIDLNLLEETLAGVVRSLDEEKTERENDERILIRIDKNLSFLRRQALLEIVQGKNADLNDVELQDLDMDPEAAYDLFLLQPSSFVSIRPSTHEIYAVAESVMPQHDGSCIFEAEDGLIAVLVRVETKGGQSIGMEEAECCAKQCIHALHAYLHIDYEASQVLRFVGMDQFQAAYRSLRAGSRETYRAAHQSSAALDGDELLTAVGNGSLERTMEILDAAMREIHEKYQEKEEKYMLLSLLLLPADLMKEMNTANGNQMNALLTICDRFFGCRSVDECRGLVMETYEELVRQSEEMNQKQGSAVIIRIREIIEQRFSSPLTIAEIAQAVFLTPTYVSQLFKSRTHQTIGEYITKKRIEKAKAMLADPTIKLYEICYAIGYSSPSYFTRVFKKETGYSPLEYRNKKSCREDKR